MPRAPKQSQPRRKIFDLSRPLKGPKIRGMQNLKLYLQETGLPPMKLHSKAPALPPNGHKSHRNHLKVQPESYRKLESIRPLRQEEFDNLIVYWMETYIPDQPLDLDDKDRKTGEYLSVPSEEYFDIDAMPSIPLPSSINRMAAWLDGYPLTTVQRIIHALFPGHEDWEFVLSEPPPGSRRDDDEGIFGHYVWTYTGKNPEIEKFKNQHSVVIAYQPPWVLSDEDIREFSQCKTFPPYQVTGNMYPEPYQSKERLWAKMWDTCARLGCQRFVLTSYHSWVMGHFTEGWTTAFVSSPFPFNLQNPGILECLVYHIASAMNFDGALRIPQVPEPIPALMECDVPKPRRIHHWEAPPESESNWDGKSDMPGSSAGVSRDGRMSPDVSSIGLPEGQEYTEHTVPQRESIEGWANVARLIGEIDAMRHIDDIALPDDFNDRPIVNIARPDTFRGEWLG